MPKKADKKLPTAFANLFNKSSGKVKDKLNETPVAASAQSANEKGGRRSRSHRDLEEQSKRKKSEGRVNS